MTVLTSLYEIGQINKLLDTKTRVNQKLLESRKNASNIKLDCTTSQADLRKIALFDGCSHRRILAIQRLEDVATLEIINRTDKNTAIREVAKTRLEEI